jgi:hypothetical protein
LVDKTYMVDAPESRENVNDIFALTNVLEKDTIEHDDITGTELEYNTILDPGELAERSKANRLSSSITDNMYQECQEMLQMFGLSWLVPPWEAEAQCAQPDRGLQELL